MVLLLILPTAKELGLPRLMDGKPVPDLFWLYASCGICLCGRWGDPSSIMEEKLA